MDYSRTYSAGGISIEENLILDIDVGDIACVTASGDQKLQNLVFRDTNLKNVIFESHRLDLWRGFSDSAEGNDPTFSGTPGDLSSSEFYSFDGGDHFVGFDNAGTQGTFDNGDSALQTFHQEAAKFTIVVWGDIGTIATAALFSTAREVSVFPGVNLDLLASGELKVSVKNLSSGTIDNVMGATSSGLGIATDDIGMMAISVDENGGASGSLFFWNDGSKVTDTFDGAYTSPSTAFTARSPFYMARVGNSDFVASTFNLFAMRVYNTNLSEAELDTEFARLQSRFSL